MCRGAEFYAHGFVVCSGNYPAYFGEGTRLTVLEKDRVAIKPNVTVIPPSAKECGGQEKEKKKRKKTIVCVATGFYPDHVKIQWDINGNNDISGVSTDSMAQRVDKFYKISSRLTVTAEEWHKPEKKFTCNVTFFDGTHWIETTASVDGVEDEVKAGLPSREKYLNVTQYAKLSYTVFIIKSCFYGAFVTFLLFKLQSGKQKK